MKRISFLLFVLVLSFPVKAQWHLFQLHINFETNGQFAVVDTAQPDNIWQKGTPSKIFFDSAFTVPGAIVTDTINFYPPGNTSGFQVKIISPGSCWGMGAVSFFHKYKTEPYKAGGYVEVAYDTSMQFINIIYDTIEPEVGYSSYNFYGLQDTIIGGIPAFSGYSVDWLYSSFSWIWQIGVKNPYHDSLTIRFSFKSSPDALPDEGWMIDDIDLWLDMCTGGVDETSVAPPRVKIIPNPFREKAKAEIIGGEPGIYLFRVFDIYGKKIREKQVATPDFELRRENLSPGLYFYQMTGESGNTVSGKFIIQW